MARKTHHRHKHRAPRIRRRTQPGASPGTVHVAADSHPSVIRVTAYGADTVREERIDRASQLQPFLSKYERCWINVDGLGDAQLIKDLGSLFELHPLTLEDVVNVHQRAKVEPYDDYLFVVARMVHRHPSVFSEQISLFMGSNYVLTFQERAGDCLDPVRERLRRDSGRIRTAGSDYLMYAILDTIVDSYFPVVDEAADRLDQLEQGVTDKLMADAMAEIHSVRNELLMLRRYIRPHRDAINELVRDEHRLITESTRVFLRDCYDHTMQLIDLLEVYRDMCSGLRDFYLSVTSNRMNEIMKILTIIATIFMPLSFVAGLYGMNFDGQSPWNMPELHWTFGYFFALGLMGMMAMGLVYFFWRKGWLSADETLTGGNQAHDLPHSDVTSSQL